MAGKVTISRQTLGDKSAATNSQSPAAEGFCSRHVNASVRLMELRQRRLVGVQRLRPFQQECILLQWSSLSDPDLSMLCLLMLAHVYKLCMQGADYLPFTKPCIQCSASMKRSSSKHVLGMHTLSRYQFNLPLPESCERSEALAPVKFYRHVAMPSGWVPQGRLTISSKCRYIGTTLSQNILYMCKTIQWQIQPYQIKVTTALLSTVNGIIAAWQLGRHGLMTARC